MKKINAYDWQMWRWSLKRQEERNIQIVFVGWIRDNFPEVITIISPIVKFGGSPTQRLIQGRTQKLMGYMKGTLDIFFPHARNGFHGLFIELKQEDGKTSPEQQQMINKLNNLGYVAVSAYGENEAKRIFQEYYQGKYDTHKI